MVARNGYTTSRTTTIDDAVLAGVVSGLDAVAAARRVRIGAVYDGHAAPHGCGFGRSRVRIVSVSRGRNGVAASGAGMVSENSARRMAWGVDVRPPGSRDHVWSDTVCRREKTAS